MLILRKAIWFHLSLEFSADNIPSKRSLLSKFSGDLWEKELRLRSAFMLHPYGEFDLESLKYYNLLICVAGSFEQYPTDRDDT